MSQKLNDLSFKDKDWFLMTSIFYRLKC